MHGRDAQALGAAQLKILEKENREIMKANEILHLASAFFAQVELDRHRAALGVESICHTRREGRQLPNLRSPQGLASTVAGRPQRGAMHRRVPDARNGPSMPPPFMWHLSDRNLRPVRLELPTHGLEGPERRGFGLLWRPLWAAIMVVVAAKDDSPAAELRVSLEQLLVVQGDETDDYRDNYVRRVRGSVCV